MNNFVEYLSNNNQFFVVLFAGISSSIAALAFFTSIFVNIRTNLKQKKDSQPQLSMKLECFDNELFLLIKNNGKTPAKNISITLKSIQNNGTHNSNKETLLYGQPFDLYPNEEVQDYVCFYGESMIDNAFPIIYIYVKYKTSDNKEINYSRSVTYCKAYNKKVYADVNVDLSGISSSLKSISRSAVRTANYLNGQNLASFDEIDILSKTSFRNDLCEALKGKESQDLQNRDETISEALKGREQINLE